MSMKKNKLNKWKSEPLKDELVKDGIITDPQAIGMVIDNIFKSSQLPRNRVICTITGLPFIYRVIKMPDGSGPVNRVAMERQLEKRCLSSNRIFCSHGSILSPGQSRVKETIS
jgi:Tfp pilus assembly PilM family ATPase